MSAIRDNVDPAEIAKFDALAARWWDPGGDFRPLHEINPLRLDYIRQRAPLGGQDVLDVGCGGGILAESMASEGALVTGIDMAEGPLAVAKLHQAESGTEVDYRQATAESLADEMDARFDVVTCLELLEHVPSPAAVIEACARLVRPGGQVFFSTINRNPKAFLFAIVGAEYLLRLLACRYPRVQQIHHARRTRRLGTASRPCSAQHHGHAVQPAHPRIFAGR